MNYWLIEGFPIQDDPLAPLFEAASEGRLSLPYCSNCDQVLELGQPVCDACRAGKVSWRDAELRGSVHSATMVGTLRVLDIELVSGHRIVMGSQTPNDRLPKIGSTVVIGFQQVNGRYLPVVSGSS